MSSSLYFHRIFLTAINQLLLFRVLTVNCQHAICFSTEESSCLHILLNRVKIFLSI